VYKEICNEARLQGKPAMRVAMQCGISGEEEMLDHLLRRDRSAAAQGSPFWQEPEWGTFLKIGGLKLFVDGSLGGQTAWMRQPYKDKPDTLGVPVLDQETISRFVKKAHAGGLQVLVHAIGDAGMDATIRAYENVIQSGKNPLRHGIIHCQITTPDILERMARSRIYALVQPIFLSDDIHILESRVGPELASTYYAWGSINRLGIPMSFGTDAPISPLDPLPNIEWAVLRRDSENPASRAFCPNETVDVYTAVDAYTKGSAFTTFDENNIGRIAPGFFADLVFLDRDIFTIPPEDIHKAQVLRTMCAGETVYRL
jgi:predicted amidohydrolase YtcJ